MPEPYALSPCGVWISPNSTMYQYSRDNMRRPPAVPIALGDHEQRHVAEEIVEQIGLDQIIELLASPDPHRHRKTLMRQMIEEHLIGNQAGNGDDAPSRCGNEDAIGLIEARNAIRRGTQGARARNKLRRGITLYHRPLAMIERGPDCMLFRRVVLPLLSHGVVGRGARIVASQAARLMNRR
jgi:hypothetical protein